MGWDDVCTETVFPQWDRRSYLLPLISPRMLRSWSNTWVRNRRMNVSAVFIATACVRLSTPTLWLELGMYFIAQNLYWQYRTKAQSAELPSQHPFPSFGLHNLQPSLGYEPWNATNARWYIELLRCMAMWRSWDRSEEADLGFLRYYFHVSLYRIDSPVLLFNKKSLLELQLSRPLDLTAALISDHEGFASWLEWFRWFSWSPWGNTGVLTFSPRSKWLGVKHCPTPPLYHIHA